MESKLKVSVIVPNYNHKRFLEQRLNSIFNQSYENYEVILLDDASTDGSQAVLNSFFTHPKVSHIVLNESNSGSVFKQWTKGFGLAQGEYVWIAESDDYADEDFLKETVKILDENEQTGMVFTNTYRVYEGEKGMRLMSESKPILSLLVRSGGIITKANATDYLLNSLVITNASSVLFRRETLKRVDLGLLEAYKNAGDIFVYLGILQYRALFYLDKPLNYMRFHSQNSTKKSKKNGQVFKDKLMLTDYYLESFVNDSYDLRGVKNFVLNLFFFSLDFGFVDDLKALLKRMRFFGCINSIGFVGSQAVIFLYTHFTPKRRPFFVRNLYKKVLRISF